MQVGGIGPPLRFAGQSCRLLGRYNGRYDLPVRHSAVINHKIHSDREAGKISRRTTSRACCKFQQFARAPADNAFVAAMHWLPISNVCFVAPRCFGGVLPDPLRARPFAAGIMDASGRGGQSIDGSLDYGITIPPHEGGPEHQIPILDGRKKQRNGTRNRSEIATENGPGNGPESISRSMSGYGL